MKKNILILVMLTLAMGLFAQKVQQNKNRIVKPKKKTNYETEYYIVLEENISLKKQINQKDSKIGKFAQKNKFSDNEIKRLKFANVDLNKSKVSLTKKNKVLNAQNLKLINANKVLMKRVAELEAIINSNPKKKNSKIIKVQQQ